MHVTFVTIGQSPRDDVVPEIVALAGGGLEVHEAGLLDDADAATLRDLAPADGEAALVSRMRDGSEVVMSKAKVEARMADVLARVEKAGTDLCVVLCTGEFPKIRFRPALIAPSRLVDGMLHGLTSEDTALGVMVPAARQAEMFSSYRALARPAKVTHASPYEGDRFDAAAAELADRDMILMNCMGYSEAQRRRVAAATGRPVLLPRRLVAAAIQQLQ